MMSSATLQPLGAVAVMSGVATKARGSSPRGVSALMYACQQGDVEEVGRLLRAQPKLVEKRDRTGKTALHYCCTSDKICAAQAADLLVMAAPDLVESRDEDGFTPLHLAVIAGNMPLVTFLLANNADVNAVDSEKHTVVHWAAVCGETGALRAVLTAGASVSTPDIHGGFPLHYAAQMCGGEKDSSLGLQVLQTLLQHSDIRVNVEDGEGRQPLLWASSAGSAKAVLALIRAGASVDAPDKDGLTALHCAASRGHTDCIDTLLTLCGMSPDVIDSNGCTALHYAVTLGHADATALLLAHGADANRQDRKGRSPAHCGCAKGQFETVKLIGNNNANLWLKNARGDLPLHEAASSGRRDLVKWLLEARPSQVNARNNDGRCPLHLAALNDNADMCKILLDAGAQINPVLRTSKNVFMTPLDCALQRGFRTTAKYLQLHGGVPANRLSSSKTKIPNGSVPFQVREDLTLWADNSTSDSERENGDKDGKEKKSRRHHRRKLAYRYEKRKEPATATATDEENMRKPRSADRDQQRTFRNDKHRSDGKTKTAKVETVSDEKNDKSKDSVTYNSEVKITNNYGGINIEKNGEIIIGGDGFPLIQTASPSATSKTKTDVKIKQISEDNEDTQKATPNENDSIIPEVNDTNNNSELEKVEKPAEPPIQTKSSINIDENIEEIKTLANTIEQTAKNITKEVINMQQNLQEDVTKIGKQPDQQSLLSNTSVEESEHKELVVEASVHEPPKETTQMNEEVQETATEVDVEESKAETVEEIKEEFCETTEEVTTEIINTEIQLVETTKIVEQTREVVEEKPAEHTDETLTKQDENLDKTTSEVIETTEIDIKAEPTDQIETKFDETIKEIEDPKVDDEPDEQSEKKVLPEEETKIEEEQKIASSKEETPDVSIETPDTVKLADSAVLEDQKTFSDADPKAESFEDETKPEEQQEEVKIVEIIKEEVVIVEGAIDEEEPEREEVASPKNAKEANAEGVTAVSVESKNKQDEKKKFLKVKKAKKADEESPKEKIRRDKTPRGEESVRDVKTKRKEKAKKDVKIQEKLEKSQVDDSFRKDEVEKNSTRKSKEKEKPKEKVRKKAIEKILEVTHTPTAQETQEKLKKRKKTTTDRVIKRKEKQEERSNSSSSSSESISRKKHRSFTVLEGNVEKRKVRITRSKSPIGVDDEVKTKSTGSKIPTPISNLRREFSVSDQHLDRDSEADATDTRISLPNLLEERQYGRDLRRPPPAPAYSENERSVSDREGDEVRSAATRRRRLRKRMKRDSRSAGSDYESSNLIDSGFEPSPRSSRIPKWKNMSERGVCMTSVTQTIQSNIRRYHLERKIFQHLLELKRLQIRSGQHNETVLVKRAIDEYHNSCAATVGAGRYVPEDYSFKSFERFLYHSLRKLQKNGSEYLKGLPESPSNPLLCTQSTHRCFHATHAYTGIPCAAYLPKMDHHTIPKIGYPCKPSGFLPQIGNVKKTVTLELCHGGDKQVISLPTDRLDQNKRYYVTFTVKGNEPSSPTREEDQPNENAHRHAKSV